MTIYRKFKDAYAMTNVTSASVATMTYIPQMKDNATMMDIVETNEDKPGADLFNTTV